MVIAGQVLRMRRWYFRPEQGQPVKKDNGKWDVAVCFKFDGRLLVEEPVLTREVRLRECLMKVRSMMILSSQQRANINGEGNGDGFEPTYYMYYSSRCRTSMLTSTLLMVTFVRPAEVPTFCQGYLR
jgi:hypothetical protein